MSARRTLLLVFTVALVLRAGWVLVRWQTRGPALEFPDEQIHWQLAHNLATRGELVTDDGRYAARMPGYPLFLLPFAMLGTTGILAAQLTQALIGAATAVIVAAFVRAGAAAQQGADDTDPVAQPRLAGLNPEWMSLAAGLLVAVDPYAIFFAALLLTEVLFTLEAVLLVAATVSWCRRRGRAGAVGVAFFGMAAILTRPSAVGWIVLLWGWLLVFQRFQRPAWRLVAASALTLAAALIPWAIRNRIVIGGPAWLSTNGGVTLYDALGPQATGASDQSFLEAMPELASMSELQRDRYLYRKALETVRRDPLRVGRLAWVKFVRTWSPLPNAPQYRGSPAAWFLAVYTVALLALSAAGLGFWRQEPVALTMILLPVVYFTLLHSVFIGSVRYRVPLMPLLAILAAGGLCRFAAPRRVNRA